MYHPVACHDGTATLHHPYVTALEREQHTLRLRKHPTPRIYIIHSLAAQTYLELTEAGKVFTKEELEGIASVVAKHPRIIVISDEVYEHSVFGDAEHVRFATLPGMWSRTLSLYVTFLTWGFIQTESQNHLQFLCGIRDRAMRLTERVAV